MSEQTMTTVKVGNDDDLTKHLNQQYNFAGVMADIALHIELELQNAAKETRVPWGCESVESVTVDGDDVIRFNGIKPADQPEEFTISHSVEIVKINLADNQRSYVERINLLINGSLYGQFTHVSREEIYKNAQAGLYNFNNPVKAAASWRS